MDESVGSFHINSAARSTLNRPMLRLFRGLIAVYVFLLVLLPSGTMLGINFKVISFLLLMPVAVQVSFARGQMTVARVVTLLSVPVILLLWAFSSQLYGYDSAQAIGEYKDLMVTIIGCWFAAVLCQEEQQDVLFFLRSVIYAEVFTSTLKLAILTYAFTRGIPVSSLIDSISRIFGVQLMAFDFEMALGRIQFLSDNLIPVCVFSVLCYRRHLSIRAGQASAIIFVLVVSDLFSFSRYLWGFLVVALLCGLLLGQKDRFQAILLTILTSLTLVSLPFLILVVSLRFSTTVVDSSDADRVAQVAALRVFIADAPWFGHGLGSYTHRIIRNVDAPYSYEAQLLALLGQIGIVGVTYLSLLTASYFRKLWPNEGQSGVRRAGLLILLLAWLAGGFFNPSLISAAASVSYAAIFAMAALKDLNVPAFPGRTD